jgi:NADH dehydrogenase FAD-containing subunit
MNKSSETQLEGSRLNAKRNRRAVARAGRNPERKSFRKITNPRKSAVEKLNIGIIGGGIGGVATAVALHRAGIEATVYERATELREVGAGMMLWPNATRVLKELGLLE